MTNLWDYYNNLLLNSTMLTLMLNMYAVPKGRPRFSAGHTYTPPATKAFESQVAAVAVAKRWPIYSCPVVVTIEVSVAIPKSYTKIQRELAEHQMTTPLRGDLDNRVKAITDALNGIAYYDDVQITEMRAKKVFGEKDFIVVTIMRAGLSDTEIDRYKKLKARNDK